MLDAGALCATHVERPATDTCARCGNFVCGWCSEQIELETYCRACAPRFSTKGEHSSRAIAALVLGLLSLMIFCLPLSIPAVILGHMETAAIDRGESPPGGRNLARGGLILGWIGVAGTAIAVLVGLAYALG